MIVERDVDLPAVQAELQASFAAYEQALTSNDIIVLTNFFHDSPKVVRYGTSEVLYGIEAIAQFRRDRGGSPPRELTRLVITAYGQDFGVAQAEFARQSDARRGRQTQTWVRFTCGWRIVSAHVSFETP